MEQANLNIRSLPHLVAGGSLAFFLLVVVNKFEFFGSVCYYIGPFSVSSVCIPPVAYYGAWLGAIGLAAYGIFKPEKKLPGATPPQ